MNLRSLFAFLLLSCLAATAFSQDNPEGTSLPHYFTPEELLRKHEIGRDFTPTEPPETPVRMVAEFEEMQSVLVRYPFGIPMTLIAEMSQDCKVMTIVANGSQQQTVLSQYQSSGVNTANCEWLIAPTDSYWTRDYGPWFVVDGSNDVGICDVPYNRPRPSDDNIPVVLAGQLGIPLYGMNLIHTGGNWMCDGISKSASSELVLEENPGLSQQQVDTLVSDYLGVKKYNIIDDPLGEYIKHIDCWAKFLDVDKVLVGQVPTWDPRYNDYEFVANYFAFQNSSWGNKYQVYRVYTPGGSPATPYTNSLILNKKVFVPLTGSQWDDEALDVYEAAMPGYEIVGVMHTNNTWENTDALHCRAKGIADLGMLYVDHMPLLGQKNFQLEWELDATIIPYSGAVLVSDSLICYYKVDLDEYQAVPLTHVTGRQYKATLPFVEPTSQVSYYLQAKDFTGRKKYHPYIGAPDPHVFTVKFANDAVISPDTLEFLTVEDMVNGKSFDIYNFTTDWDLMIEDMETSGTSIPWYIDPWNITLPHSMDYTDTLTFTVKINMPVDHLPGEMVFDTLDITTEYSTKQVIIKVDGDLLSGSGELFASGPELMIYPNPVSNTARVAFTLGKATPVNLDVFNMEGSKVRTLAAGHFASGDHVVECITGQLPSGIYFIRMLTDEGISTRKMVIVR